MLGFGYPALMTGFAQLAFSHKANGSLSVRNGTVVGSSLAAQAFTVAAVFPRAAVGHHAGVQRRGHDLLQPRPDEPGAREARARNAKAILALEGPYNPGLTIHQIPVDAVVPSGSGIDPEISLAYAQLQARRVAAVRHLPLATVRRLIAQSTDGRALGLPRRAGRQRPRARPRTRPTRRADAD